MSEHVAQNVTAMRRFVGEVRCKEALLNALNALLEFAEYRLREDEDQCVTIPGPVVHSFLKELAERTASELIVLYAQSDRCATIIKGNQ